MEEIVKEKKSKAKMLGKEVAIYLTDSIAGLSTTSPLFALVEKTINQMTNEVSWNTRKSVFVLVMSGYGYATTRLRDVSLRTFKVKTENITQHDKIFNSSFNLVASPLLYLWGGETDWMKIGIGTAMSVAIGYKITGPVLGYSFETNREFLSIEPSKRLPESITSLPKPVKLACLAMAPIASYLLIQGIYAVTPSWEKQPVEVKPVNAKVIIAENQRSAADSLKEFAMMDSLDALANYYSADAK